MRLSALVIASAFCCASASAAPPPLDPELVKGIKLVQEGSYGEAIFSLDNAARRLASDHAKVRELSQAYLYLGIAYLGKGSEAAAKSKFIEAIAQVHDLSLSPQEFAPKVIEIFEAARLESGKAGKKGGLGTGVLIGAGIGVTGAGVALLASGGSSEAPSTDGRSTETFSSTVTVEQHARNFPLVVSKAGTLDAKVTWTGAGAVLVIIVYDDGKVAGLSSRIADREVRLSMPVTPKTYNLAVAHDDVTSNGTASFTLTVSY
jgi:hypothetical protein